MSAGSGTSILSGSDNYTGGTTVTAGTLIVTSDIALSDGTSLTVGAGASLIFDPSMAGSPVSNSAAAVAVPEPATSALSGVGALALIAYGWRRRTSRKSNRRRGGR